MAWPRHAPQLAGSFYKRHAVTPASRCSDCLWAGGFRCCFTPLPGCFSPFPRGTSALSVTGEYLGLEGGPPCFPPGFTCPAVLGHRQAGVALRVRGSNPLRPGFPSGSARAPLCNRTVDGPTTPARLSLGPVWPLPRSLATTGGISLDFSSSGYLDVSVPRVAPSGPMRSARRRRASTARRVFPFGDPRVKGRVPLTADYRSLPRPSSASCAKASAACPYHLPSISDGMVSRLIRPRLAGPLGVILHEMRSSRRKSSLVTLCSSQGTARASPGDRTPRGEVPRRPGDWKGPEAWRLGLTGRPVAIIKSSLEEVCLPRKEVIQPHLPVRLPCYDFTPLTSHTFGTSPPVGLGRRLRVQATRVV